MAGNIIKRIRSAGGDRGSNVSVCEGSHGNLRTCFILHQKEKQEMIGL